MAEQERKPQVEQSGAGVDRSLIRNMLALTPAQRLDVLVVSARNLAALLAKARRV